MQVRVVPPVVSGGKVIGRQVGACGLRPLSLTPVQLSWSKVAIKSNGKESRREELST